MGQDTGVQFQPESYQRFKKWHLMPLGLTHQYRYGSRVSGTIQRKEKRPPLHFIVVAIKREALGSPTTPVGQLTYIYIYIERERRGAQNNSYHYF